MKARVKIAGPLFWRLFATVVAAILAAVLLLSAVMVTIVRSERQAAYEQELMTQLRVTAELMQERYALTDVQLNNTFSKIVESRIADMRERYKGSLWLVNWQSSGYGVVQILDSEWDTQTMVYEDSVSEQLRLIQRGNEIRVQGMFPELGAKVVTLGVPWTYKDETVVGAVLLHVSVDDLIVDYSDMAGKVVEAALAALALGALLAFFVARGQTRPIQTIRQAVADFAAGRLDTRVEIRASAELMTLADAFNRMAGDLENLEDSRRQFVANVSHELRSPLTSIQGYLQAILDGTVSAGDMERYLGVVIAETRRLTKLVNELLELSRIESGVFELTVAPFDVGELIRRAAISLLPRIEEKSIELALELDEALPPAMGDSERIRQVVNNLLDNAVKFAPERGTVTVSASHRAGKITVRVANDGEPISQADLPHIFDRFYKADKARTSGQGTGLGLAIVKKILEQHGETVSAFSGESGAEFAFSLSAQP